MEKEEIAASHGTVAVLCKMHVGFWFTGESWYLLSLF